MEPSKPKGAFFMPPDFTKKPALFKQGKDDLIFIIGQMGYPQHIYTVHLSFAKQ